MSVLPILERSMSRSKFGVAAVTVSSVFLLSGCLSLEMDLNIQSDGLASGNVTIGLEEETASSFGFDSSEAFTEYFVAEQIGETGLESDGGGIDPDSCRPADVSGSVAVTCTFTDLEFPEAEAGETGWWVSTTEDTVTLFFENTEAETSDDPVAFAQVEGSMLGSSEITLNVTMPGNITSVEGDAVEQTSDTTVVIQTPSTSAATATVVSERYPSEGGGVPVVLIGVAGVLVVGGAAAFYFSRRASGGGDGSGTQAAPGGWVPTQAPPMSEPPSEPRREPGSTWEY